MKKLLVIAVALAAVNAQASRARVVALGNAPHIIDTATVLDEPADIHSMSGDYVLLESGTTTGAVSGTSTVNTNPMGMIVRSMGDAKVALALGNQSANASTWGLRGSQFNIANLQYNQQNPLELTYGAKSGDMGWAATLVYSNYNDKTAAGIKESSSGLRFGARASNWDATLRVGLSNTVETAADGKFTGTTSVALEGGYQMDSIYWNGEISTAGFKRENATGVEQAKFTATGIRVGALTSIKKDGNEVFYGASIEQTEAKETVNDVKVTSLSLPLIIGVEHEAASWLTLRGSITQTVQLLNNDKTEVGGTTTTETAPGANDTTVAGGAGLKFNKVQLDGTLTAQTSQTINTTNLLGTVGLTYMF